MNKMPDVVFGSTAVLSLILVAEGGRHSEKHNCAHMVLK